MIPPVASPPTVDASDRCQCGAKVDLSVTVLWDRVQRRITGCPACHDWFRWGGRRPPPATLAPSDDTPMMGRRTDDGGTP